MAYSKFVSVLILTLALTSAFPGFAEAKPERGDPANECAAYGATGGAYMFMGSTVIPLFSPKSALGKAIDKYLVKDTKASGVGKFLGTVATVSALSYGICEGFESHRKVNDHERVKIFSESPRSRQNEQEKFRVSVPQ